ncbi:MULTISPECIES: type I 3-dehydroquinate dehydratase [unclassified Clostridioides]|uniref:type I 3-dehydroquinate dehydratase n=1 Tax=unclassified Clostridioides TaxID=2635829 RepID=UPI001D0C147F|nr:type I 3-dehydroquinate dehydratase [Clostridioides sp. ES-S-0049-03]MCC0654951.1 type I 3-dehydroquinate dehydratase [Clostridioides sp. ES-S-0123-01]MCC0673632.1 type I 3-dehydroquinate dehydratase [Clostridioides sp. ES-S-0145-01]MCC0675275.1 type I 3-dehydroquinate dehydratase [Clostridioides sp. ES-W-0018-02]MCC0679893.1 type I 3-dehydroquinate dehydratase [Clostridioides sp. ES-S-0005-03]MCC0694980.1 type I 3-dehydroquinate dehydratase [Clostridioides sp. ES-S-0048-02]MCC0709915.1 ty
MNNIVQVKNIRIGEGIPKICVPIVGKTKEEIIEEVNDLKEICLDVVEWRVDFFENVENIQQVKEVINELRKYIPDTPLLFTFRSIKEGGQKLISKDYYTILNKEISNTGLIDLIDVELFMGDEIVNEIVEFAHEKEVKVVMSNHDFNKTPKKEEIISRLCKMQKLGADLPKIAVMPKNERDVLVLLTATNEMVQVYADRPIITMSMAGMGVISRLCGEIFGSALTFGAVKKVSAPGQMSVEELNSILRILHKSIN